MSAIDVRNALSAVVDQFPSFQWSDRLSGKLFDWSFKSLSQEGDVEKRIGQLFNICRNPIDNSLLENPVLYGNEVWEKWMLDEYIKAQSELGLELQLESVQVHAFALEMLKFAFTYSSSDSREIIQTQECLSIQNFQQLTPLCKFLVLFLKMDCTLMQEESEEALERAKSLEQMQKPVEKLLDQTRQSLANTEQSLEDSASGVEKSHQDHEALLHQEIENLQLETKKNSQESQALVQNTKATEQVIQSLKKRL